MIHSKHYCRLCLFAKAVYRAPDGRMRARYDHNLCRRCWRSLLDRHDVASHNGGAE